MMRHIAAYHGVSAAHAGAVHIERLIKAVFAVHSECFKLAQIMQDSIRAVFKHEKA